MSTNLPDAGKTVIVGGIETNYHDEGSGRPLFLLHGSGPGVTAWQNWSGVLPRLAEKYRVIAPDIVGFGLTKIPDGHEPKIKSWLAHVAGLIDALDLSDVTLTTPEDEQLLVFDSLSGKWVNGSVISGGDF